jgi:hypothetical protein
VDLASKSISDITPASPRTVALKARRIKKARTPQKPESAIASGAPIDTPETASPAAIPTASQDEQASAPEKRTSSSLDTPVPTANETLAKADLAPPVNEATKLNSDGFQPKAPRKASGSSIETVREPANEQVVKPDTSSIPQIPEATPFDTVTVSVDQPAVREANLAEPSATEPSQLERSSKAPAHVTDEREAEVLARIEELQAQGTQSFDNDRTFAKIKSLLCSCFRTVVCTPSAQSRRAPACQDTLGLSA